MDKILVLVEDGLLKLRIARILRDKGYAHELLSTPIRAEELRLFQLLIVHSSYRLANLSGFLRNVLIPGGIPVLFLSQNPGAVTALINKDFPEFTYIDENRIDVELPLAITIHSKYQDKLRLETAKSKKQHNRETNEKMLLMAKALLIKNGMTEKAAYELIRKRAMDEKVTKYIIAEKILKNNQ